LNGEAQCKEMKQGRAKKEQYHFEISKSFAVLENIDAEVDINKT
jgi:hypothetical protein